MFVDIIKAIFIAGIPVGMVSFFFTHLTSKKVPLTAQNSKELKIEMKNANIEANHEESAITSMLHKKWMRFGGGFFGVMVFITYVHIETYQIIEFVKNFTSFQNFIDSIGFMMILNFFFEAFTNLITAFLWFTYWYKYLPIGSFWVWLIVVFVSHSVATKYALTRTQ